MGLKAGSGIDMKDVAYYSSLRFTLKYQPLLDDECEDRDLVQEFEGEIIHTEVPEDYALKEKEHVVGHIRGSRIDLGEAFDRGVSAWDACDAHSGELEECCSVFLTDDEFREDLELSTLGDLLILHTMEIDPKYRGLGLGLLAVRRTLMTLGGGCAMAALKPFPLQFQNKVTAQNQAEFDAAQKKLGDYWSRLGFVPYKDTEYYYFDMAHRKPPISQVLGRKNWKKANV